MDACAHRSERLGTPAAFVVRRMGLEYLKPARIDEILEVVTSVKEIGAAHLVLDQRIVRDGKPLFEAQVTVVLVSVSGKPLRLSSAIRAAMASSTERGGESP